MSEIELPEGWEKANFSDICDYIQRGKSPKYASSKNDFPVVNQKSVRWHGIEEEHLKYIAPEQWSSWDEERYLKEGDILWNSTGTGTIGRACYIDKRELRKAKVVDSHVTIVRTNANISPKFVFYRIMHPAIQSTISGLYTGSTNQVELSKSIVLSIKIPLPPLAEQREIAARLDGLLAQVDSIKGRLDGVPGLLKRFRQAVLAAAVSGRLTEEWRASNPPQESAETLLKKWLADRHQSTLKKSQTLVKFKEPVQPDTSIISLDKPIEWQVVSVSEFAECLDYLRVPVKKDNRSSQQGLYPYFGANGEVDKVDDYLLDEDIVLVTEDETFYGREKPIAYRYTGKCWVNNHVHVLRAATKESNDFLCFSLMYYNVTPWLSGTTGRAKLTQAALNSLPILLPPLEEQSEIVRRVETLFAFADQLEARVKAAQAQVNQLTQAILAKAFRGELTADWRAQHPELISGENSAAALLQRIQAERAQESIKNKHRIKK